MGKIWVAVLLLGFLAVVAGCGGDRPWGNAAHVGDLVVSVSRPVEIPVQSGNKSVFCGVTFKNDGSESSSYNFLAFTMYDTEGDSYESRIEGCG